ncbi:MAG: pyridoxal phosphate-dependent aminotransferase [SAR324 cluster bacterium]|nr:pyridoxal phosphate-dependent aminotransferase [SAR324 cluster bacterium]
MKYNFDKTINMTGIPSLKWGFTHGKKNPMKVEQSDIFSGDDPALPLWVADMDFPSPQPVIDALQARAEHGVYGYAYPTNSYYDAVTDWMQKRHGWRIDKEWMCVVPGVVPGLNMLIRTFVAPGERVLIQPPVYHPFFHAIKNNHTELVSNSLIYENGQYRMDFEDLEEKTRDPAVKMAILCSPHNPVGRIWSKEELLRFGEICLRNDVLVVSDEIHGDLVFQGNVFTPFATINEEFLQKSIICTAPSKTFNLAGMKTANIVIPDERLRSEYQKTLVSNGLSGIMAFGIVAVEAAYRHGEEWLEQVLEYIESNFYFLEEYIAQHIPQIRVISAEGTYLIWLDCRQLGMDREQLKRFFEEEARVFLNEGHIFGSEGEGFQRINIACTRATLAEALTRIKKAINQM